MILNVMFELLILQGAIAASVELGNVDGNSELKTNWKNLNELRRLYPDAFVSPKGYFSDWNPFSWTRYGEEEDADEKIKKIQEKQKILFEIIKCGSIDEIECQDLVDEAELLFEEDGNKKKKKKASTTPRTTTTTTARPRRTTTRTTTRRPTTSTSTTESSSATTSTTTAADDEQNVTTESPDNTTAT